MAMRTIMMVIGLGAALMAGGCAGGGAGLISAVGTAKGMSLSHIDAMTQAAREITGDPAAQVHGLKSRPAASGAALDVCGYVRLATGESVPIYVELREQDGSVSAARGQTGQTPQNLAKVKFMCRGHGDW